MKKEEYLAIGMTPEQYERLWQMIKQPFPDLTLCIPDGVKELEKENK